MEKRIQEGLEKAGWHLKPSVVSDIVSEIEEEEGALSEREIERRVRIELLDSDLSTTGARYLPDAQSLLHLRTLPTPCVLQVAAIKDASQSNQGSGSTTGRLLHLRLTDGHTFLTAIEYRSVPSLSVDVPPGTKVTLLGSVAVHSGIVLLEPIAIRVEGGHVAALHEAWLMQRKYAGALSRSKTDGGTGPPPFRGLNSTTGRGAQAPSVPTVSKPAQDVREQGGSSKNIDNTKVRERMRPGAEPYKPRGSRPPQSDAPPQSAPPQSIAEAAPQKPPMEQAAPTPSEPKPEGRVREKAPVVAPVQNRQAAQKLLDRRTDAAAGGSERGRGGRGFRRGRGRGDDDEHDERVMTLDEWEAKKTAAPSSSHSAVSDQELARRLQEQFNLEDSGHDVQQPKQMSAAEQLRQSMFSFVPEPSAVDSGRGRGLGRGRGRGRGRR